jgi:hypothetical protein
MEYIPIKLTGSENPAVSKVILLFLCHFCFGLLIGVPRKWGFYRGVLVNVLNETIGL